MACVALRPLTAACRQPTAEPTSAHTSLCPPPDADTNASKRGFVQLKLGGTEIFEGILGKLIPFPVTNIAMVQSLQHSTRLLED